MAQLDLRARRRGRASWFGSMALAVALVGCGSPSSPSAGAAGSDPLASPPDAAASAAGDPAVIADIGDALADATPTRLALAGQDVDEALDEAGGQTRLLGAATVDWLSSVRSAAVATALEGMGVDATAIGPTRLSTEPVAAAGPVTAVGEGWVGTTVGVPLIISSLTSRIGDDVQTGNEPSTTENETTANGQRTVARTTTHFTSRIAGSRVIVDGDVTQTSTTTDAQGAVVGTGSYRSHVHAELQACPDASGEVHLSLEIDLSSGASGAGSGTAFDVHATSQQTGHVGDDAWLQESSEELEVSQSVTAPDGTRTAGSSRRSTRTVERPNGGGFERVADASSSVGEGTMDPDESVRWGNFVQMTAALASQRAFKDAQEAWRGGKCVAVEASERTRDVPAEEIIRFESWPVHKIEGGRLDKKIVATLAGIQSILPEGTAQDAPAPLTFISGPDRDDRGTVTLKSTSNRGIGTLDLTFTVRPSVVLELEIDSKIKPTVLNTFTVKRGTATAQGRIRLVEVQPDHWRGDGTLASETNSAAGGCRSMRVVGTGSYDWQVRDVVAGPEIAAADIVVDIDSGRQSEQPDTFGAKACPVLLDGTMNTWENLFFLIYNAKKNVNGLRVTGWTLDATPDTWVNGGLVATAKWSGSCPGMQDPTDPDLVIMGLNECTDNTTFRIWAVPTP